MRHFPPRRIVCLTEETVETLYLLGEQDRIVGVSGYAVRPPQVRREKPRVSAFISADIPKILKLEPDTRAVAPARGGVQVGFVLHGDGEVNGEALRKHSAFSGKDDVALSTRTGMEVLLVGLPIFAAQTTSLMAAE